MIDDLIDQEHTDRETLLYSIILRAYNGDEKQALYNLCLELQENIDEEDMPELIKNVTLKNIYGNSIRGIIFSN